MTILTVFWVRFSADDILKYISNFPQRIRFNNICKLSTKACFLGKKRKTNIANLSSAELDREWETLYRLPIELNRGFLDEQLDLFHASIIYSFLDLQQSRQKHPVFFLKASKPNDHSDKFESQQ